MELTTCRCQVAYTILDYLCDNKCYPFKIELILFILLHSFIHTYIHTHAYTGTDKLYWHFTLYCTLTKLLQL